MIILDSTSKTLQVTLGASPANALPYFVSYIDATGTATTPGDSVGTISSASAQTIVSAPASSTQRLVKSINIQNANSAATTVKVQFYNGTAYNIIVVTLAVGDQLIYEDGNGWVTLDSNGNIKTTGNGVSSITNTDGTLTISPTTGNVVASLALPTWNVIGISGTASSYTGSTSETLLASVAIPAGAMGKNGILRVTSLWSCPSNGNNKTVRYRLGGLPSGTTIWGTTVTTENTISMIWSVVNDGSNGKAQKFFNGPSLYPYNTASAGVGTASIDTTSSTTLAFTTTLGSSGDTVTLEAYLVELMHGA